MMAATYDLQQITPLRSRQYVLCLVGLLFMWPALLNGAPFLFPDTSAYIRGVDAAVMRSVGHATEWSNDDVRRIVTRADLPKLRTISTVPPRRPVAKSVLLGRSVYYGVLLYAAVIGGTLWLAIIAQALIAGGVIVGFVRHFVDPLQERRFAASCLITALLLGTTTLPWFVSMTMPDLFAGLSITSAAVLIAGGMRETIRGRLFWATLAAYGALVHSSDVLILLALAGTAFAVSLVAAVRWRRGAAVLTGAALIGILGEASFGLAVYHATGVQPVRPPFFTARLVADGPGLRVLQTRCPDVHFALCAYVDRLPLESDSFLWSHSPRNGVFMAVPISVQRELSTEQFDFARTVMLDRPLDVLRHLAIDITDQFSLSGLPEFEYTPSEASNMLARLPASDHTYIIDSRAYRRNMPTEIASFATLIWTSIGLISSAAMCSSRRYRGIRDYAMIIIVGWLADLVVCGTLSTPHDRYQTRVLWLLAFIPILFIKLRQRLGINRPGFVGGVGL